MITLDFETEAIVGNPIVNPPLPVGLAIYWPSGLKEYITEWELMKVNWEAAINSVNGLLFHNAPFDLSVGGHYFGTEWPNWTRVHDTMFLLFLADPYADTLSLKPSAERYLGDPPDTQNDLYDWIVSNVPGATRKRAGEFICKAPVELVRPYAIDDVIKTKRLYDYLTEELFADEAD